MAKPVDLHALANMHGAGLAQTALRKAGHWDEYAGKTAREYRVKVSYSIQHEDTKIVTVTARCEVEAEDLAADMIEADHEYDVEIDSTEVLPDPEPAPIKTEKAML